MSVHSYTKEIAEFFKERPYQWVNSRALEQFGRQAWRTRVSECRTELGMTVENRQRRVKTPDPWSTKMRVFTVSEYRYVPPATKVVDDTASVGV